MSPHSPTFESDLEEHLPEENSKMSTVKTAIQVSSLSSEGEQKRKQARMKQTDSYLFDGLQVELAPSIRPIRLNNTIYTVDAASQLPRSNKPCNFSDSKETETMTD